MTAHHDLHDVLQNITPDVYASLKRAVELGRWQNGTRLTDPQRELCLQAVIYYDARQKPEYERVGFIARENHTHCGSEGDENHDNDKNRWNTELLLAFKSQSSNTLKH